ncbi:dynein regulatory complex subunit 3-like isoform X2 [Pollicipes pollicipes]|uniref:dynein regulatory complex subunit 3-like isoform X2 n=1 Tax=Pollicipes pollicipes TaxID=41117 RepID=UPI001884BC01|nr:dynein regulatory complex subunit 3-like isoform X2 [Pollicipes pollicipes]
MNNLYVGEDPVVISHALLSAVVLEQSPKGEAETIVEREPVRFNDVKELSLSYKRILRIDNMWEFTALTKLQLDNNIIESIQNLFYMPNLKWLDLSFNRIEKIENLDQLVNLEDLSLFSNNISVLENMDKQQKLQVLSIGNNCIEKLDNVLYLRALESLGSLGLAGNPCAEDPEYKTYVGAFLRNLTYLDYRLVREEWRAEGLKKHSYIIEEMELLEHRDEFEKEKKEKQSEQEERFREAFVEGLSGGQLFDQLFEDDKDGEHLSNLQGADEIRETLRGQVVPVCKQIFDVGIEKEKQRAEEISQLVKCLYEARRADQDKAVRLMDEFLAEKDALLGDIANAIDFAEETGINDETEESIDKAIQIYSEHCQKLWSQLMGSEVVLNDGLEEVIQEFGRNLTDMVSSMLEATQVLFAQLRDLEAGFTEQITELALHVLEKVIRNDEDVELPLETAELFTDKEVVMSLVAGSHDAHMQAIDGREDTMTSRLKTWLQSTIANMLKEEEERNRSRVIEINHFLDKQRDELDDFDVPRVQVLEDDI